MLLLAGDLFHENKPSRTSLYQTTAALRQYTRGSKPVELLLVGDEGFGIPRDVPSVYSYPLYPTRGAHARRLDGRELITRMRISTLDYLFFQFMEITMIHKGPVPYVPPPLPLHPTNPQYRKELSAPSISSQLLASSIISVESNSQEIPPQTPKRSKRVLLSNLFYYKREVLN